MAIDIHTRKPVFDNISAGLSGPAIRPIALRMVWELYEALSDSGKKPAIPIVGLGGIFNAGDALEYFMAGAAAIQVGSATFARPTIMIEIIDGIEIFMRDRGYTKISDLPIR